MVVIVVMFVMVVFCLALLECWFCGCFGIVFAVASAGAGVVRN